MQNTDAAAIPLILILLTIIICGALFSLLFFEIAFPEFDTFIPASDYKTTILMLMRAIPLFIIFAGIVAAIKAGIKKEVGY